MQRRQTRQTSVNPSLHSPAPYFSPWKSGDTIPGIIRRFCHFQPFGTLAGSRDISADPEKVALWTPTLPIPVMTVSTLLIKPYFAYFSAYPPFGSPSTKILPALTRTQLEIGKMSSSRAAQVGDQPRNCCRLSARPCPIPKTIYQDESHLCHGCFPPETRLPQTRVETISKLANLGKGEKRSPANRTWLACGTEL